jgi:branched-chain amino acid transport system ATP-binding protein
VYDNLLLAAYDLPRGERARASRRRSAISRRSPRSATSAPSLSGGQQQMLAVAQGLVRRPRC